MAYRHVLAGLIALSLLVSCGRGGSAGGNGLTPFPTVKTDELPPGTRIDVSGKNLFPMAAGDSWSYTSLDAGGNPTGTFATRQVTADDGAGHVTLVDNDGVSSTTNYTVSADGLFDPQPAGDVPAIAHNIIGGIFEYVTPLYPVGAVRRHVRSGPLGEDLDGDGVGESFRFEYTQVFLGFETLQISPTITFTNVAHFHNVFRTTLRPTDVGNTDYTITETEDTWFAPGFGLAKAVRSALDSDGFTLDPVHTLVFLQGVIGGANWNVNAPPPPPLDGAFIDIRLDHNALVYDSVRNVYYASLPASVSGHGNSIAIVDPATGQVSYSAPVGSEPHALAIAADANTLYVGLDGSSELAKLALPGMNELWRTKIANPSDPARPTYAETIAVSPVDASVVAVAMAFPGSSARHAGVALFRDMVMQPKVTQVATGSNLITFDSDGTKVYGLNTEDTEFGLRRIQVLADGLSQELIVGAATDFGTRQLSFSNGRVIAGRALYNAPDLTTAGLVSAQSDCRPQRSGSLLMCFDVASFSMGMARILLVDPGSFVIAASVLFAYTQSGGPFRNLVEGPAGQVAISYPFDGFGFYPSKIRLFSSAKLPTPPAPPPPSWPITASSTPDGQALEIGIVHNSLAYDTARNVYYASVPGSVVGAGNSIAIIDPATGQVSHSAPIGSEPNLLAISADNSVLYVSLDGSGEVLRLALPSMAEQGRVRLPLDNGFKRQERPVAIAVSPADSTVAAVTMGDVGVALLRDMVMEPKRVSPFGIGNNLLAFGTAGTTLYGLASNGGDALNRFSVLADGLSDDLSVTAATNFNRRALSLSGNMVVADSHVYDAASLAPLGGVADSSNCWAARSNGLLLCLGDQTARGRVQVADATTFAIGASLVYSVSESETETRRLLVQGPADQIAVSYPVNLFGTSPPRVRLFSSTPLP